MHSIWGKQDLPTERRLAAASETSASSRASALEVVSIATETEGVLGPDLKVARLWMRSPVQSLGAAPVDLICAGRANEVLA